jgi:hypothetical protein
LSTNAETCQPPSFTPARSEVKLVAGSVYEYWVLIGVVRVLDRRQPGIAARVLPVDAHERVIAGERKVVLGPTAIVPRRIRARAVVDRRLAGDRITGRRELIVLLV